MLSKTLRLTGIALLMGGFTTGAFATIVGSKHDFTSGGGGANKVTSPTSVEICAFCHTPHGGIASSAPLWNKGSTTATFTYYKSTGMDSGRLAVGSVSVGCLSCHDGTQAMDNMVNQPGSDGYNATGTSANYTWTGANQTAGKMNANAGVAFIGTDLTNDHPIGIAYCAWTTFNTGSAPSAAPLNDFVPANDCNDKDFKTAKYYTDASSNPFWYVDTGTAGKQKDDIVLYTRDFGTSKLGPSVECASCHDPHQTANGPFLRISNAGSKVCTSCHAK